jgi:hypothetical protein
VDRRAVLATSAAFAAFARAARPSSGAPITLNGALALVPVTIGVQGPHLFLIDTGAEVCVLDPEIGVRRGAGPMELTAAGQTRAVDYVQLDLGLASAAIGARIHGLLGANFFAPSAAHFDFAAQRLALHESASRPVDGQDLFFHRIPYVRAQARLGGVVIEGLFGLDTGLDTGVKFFRSAMGGRLDGVATTPGRTATATGSRVSALAPVEAVRLAGLDIVNLQADISDDAPPRHAPLFVLGMIGAPAFANRVLTLDFPGGWWSLSPVIL